MTPEERESIIMEAVERALLKLPAVMGNLMAQAATYNKITSQFYKDHPEFSNHKPIVAQVLERIDGKNPALSLEEKMTKAVPEIQAAIRSGRGLNTTAVKPEIEDRRFKGGGNQGDF